MYGVWAGPSLEDLLSTTWRSCPVIPAADFDPCRIWSDIAVGGEGREWKLQGKHGLGQVLESLLTLLLISVTTVLMRASASSSSQSTTRQVLTVWPIPGIQPPLLPNSTLWPSSHGYVPAGAESRSLAEGHPPPGHTVSSLLIEPLSPQLTDVFCQFKAASLTSEIRMSGFIREFGFSISFLSDLPTELLCLPQRVGPESCKMASLSLGTWQTQKGHCQMIKWVKFRHQVHMKH